MVKRYVAETGSSDVNALIGAAEAIGTGVVSRAEVAAALAKAARVGLVTRDAAARALAAFGTEWQHFIRLQFSEPLAARAATLAWDHGLRVYDAVHLATALFWQETVGETVTLATYDRELWRSAEAAGLTPWPAPAAGIP
jgi:predicted nucleic acid-binding protein